MLIMSIEKQSYESEAAISANERTGNNESSVHLHIEERKLVRKIDLFLLPTIWLMYLLSYVDRTKSVH